MNQLRAWLYGHDIQNRWHPQGESQQESHADSTVIPNNLKRSLDADFEQSGVRRFLLNYVPLQPGDCLGCKLIGTTVMAISGVIVLTSVAAGRTRNPNLIGRKLLTYKIVCGSLFVGFETAAFCRFFDLGPFAKVTEFHRQE